MNATEPRTGWQSREDIWRWLAGQLGMPALLATPSRALDRITLPAPLIPADVMTQFAGLVGPLQLREDAADRARHARGRGYQDVLRLRAGDLSSAPDAVIYPRREEDVLAILKLAAAKTIGVVPFGGGNGGVGGVSAAPGRISLDLTEMSRLTVLDRTARTVTAEAGIGLAALEAALNAKGLSLGLDEDFASASLGGWIASGGGREVLRGARLATAHGLHVFGEGFAAGPDLQSLLPGSEGVLGTITQATLRIRTLTRAACRLYVLRDFASGLALAQEALRLGLAPSRLHLSDGGETRFRRKLAALEKSPSLIAWLETFGLFLRRFGAQTATLALDFSDESTARKMDLLVKQLGGLRRTAQAGFEWRQGARDWPRHHDGFLDRGVGVEIFETAASWTRLPLVYVKLTRALEEAMRRRVPKPGAHGLVLAHMHQAGARAARLTVTAVFPRQLNDEMGQAQAIRDAGLAAICGAGGALALNGVGENYLAWMAREKSAADLDLLRGLKHTLDPENILNPGKLIPPRI